LVVCFLFGFKKGKEIKRVRQETKERKKIYKNRVISRRNSSGRKWEKNN
jgi:hypothetical protein